MNKRQKKNRKRLAKITKTIFFVWVVLSFGVVGNIELEYFNIISLIIYIVTTITTIILFELCDYLKIEL